MLKVKKPAAIENKTFISPMEQSQKYVLIRFPKKIINYLGINGERRIYCTPTAGILQLSLDRPDVTIPVLVLNKKNFVNNSDDTDMS